MVGRDAVDDAAAKDLDQRVTVGRLAQGRVHLARRVERADVLVDHRQVVRAGLTRDRQATRLGVGDRVDRLARGRVLEVDPAVLVGGQRAVAGDHRRLADAGDAGDAEQCTPVQ